MGAHRFEREPPVPNSNKNVIEFDSSAERALSRAYGWDESSVLVMETERTDSVVTLEVYAAEYPGSEGDFKPSSFRGRLRCLTRDEAWRQQTTGPQFTGRFG